jgi:hypothetical protein
MDLTEEEKQFLSNQKAFAFKATRMEEVGEVSTKILNIRCRYAYQSINRIEQTANLNTKERQDIHKIKELLDEMSTMYK